MLLKPSSLDDLCQSLAAAHSRGEKITQIQLGALNQIVGHSAEDMTATVQAGVTLAEFQKALAQRGQWLPLDPPNPDTLTIGELLSANHSGPRRFGYGTVRDYVIGLKAALPDGRLIKSGGQVVKNVAGYDLAKLFIGGGDSLGIIVEATFKLHPLPEAEAFVQTDSDSLAPIGELIEKVLASPLTPTVFDLHNVEAEPHSVSAASHRRNRYTVVLGFAGPSEDVSYQLGIARELGVQQSSNLAYEIVFWKDQRAAHHRSVLPSALLPTVQSMGDIEFVSRAGNGIVWHRGGPLLPPDHSPKRLIDRVKNAFDPRHILPNLAGSGAPDLARPEAQATNGGRSTSGIRSSEARS